MDKQAQGVKLLIGSVACCDMVKQNKIIYMSSKKQTNGHVLVITPGQVNLPVVENIADANIMESSIFRTQYKQMLSCLNTYVKYRKDAVKEENVFMPDAPNNVFTFVGERGSGKTSCMTSVSSLLTSGKIHSFVDYENLARTDFTSIDLIDPSYFDKNHNIVAMMVAKLYKAFRKYDESNDSNRCNRDYRDELIDSFSKTQRNMQCLLEDMNGTDGYTCDDIENLSDLSVAIDLKTDIQQLVKTYLRFIKKENGLLVLSIDDIDLNVSEADTMAEQIRKYLVNPNIIILLAAKLDQLAMVKNLHYAEKFEPLLKNNRMEYNTVEEMTSQFLTKFAPHDQRVYMPADDIYLNSGIKIETETWYGDSVMQVVPELIFNRTRYLFYNSKQTPSYIIPRNLRKLCQLVAMLWSMDYYHDADPKANKGAFRNYLFGAWVQDNLPQDDRKYVTRLLDGWENEQLNRIALDVLIEKYNVWVENKLKEPKTNIDKSDLQDEIRAVIDGRIREFNIAIGDIMSLISVLEVAHETHADKCFFFIMKSIYSMALYETYDWITDKQDNVNEAAETENVKKEDDNLVMLYDPFDDEHIENYHKLIGGRFYNYRMNSVLAKEKITETIFVSRSDRMISYSKLNDEIISATSLWSEIKDKDGHVPADRVTELSNKVRMCEFFMLCCIRDINKRHSSKNMDFYDASYRQSDTVYYNGDYVGKDWLYFDLGAFFFNITRMDDCYRRYKDSGKTLWLLCQKDEDGISLYSTFRKKALDYRKDYTNPHAWQSWASIRNTEILFDLNQHLRAKCRLRESGNQKHLSVFFKELANYRIKTYDRDAKGSKLNINFEFADQIAELLGKDEVKENFDEIFNANTIAVEIGTPSFDKTSGEFPQIDMDNLLKRRKSEGNKKDNIRTYLNKKENHGLPEFGLLVEAALSQFGDTLTKEEVRTVGNNLNLMLYSKYGNTQRNAEDSIPQAGPEDTAGEAPA